MNAYTHAPRTASLLVVGLAIFSIVLGACQPAPVTPAAGPTATPSPKAALASRHLRVGSDTTYPPFESIDPATGRAVGFDPDLLAWICQDQHCTFEFITGPWDGMFTTLADRTTYDIVMSAASITEERKQIVDFTDPYFEIGQVVVTRKGDDRIKSYKDLVGKTVGVQTATTGEEAALKVAKVPESYLDRYDDFNQGVKDLLAGKLDAVIGDEPTCKSLVGEHPDQLQIVGGEGQAAWFTKEGYGIAVPKGETELLNALNTGIANARKAGVIDQLTAKWKIGQ